jgi:hypothetical protein
MKAKTVLVPQVAQTSTTYYTTPANTRAKVVFLQAAHTVGTGSTTVNIHIKNSSTITIFHGKNLGVGEVANIGVSDSSYIMLESGYEIVADADDDDCALIITVEETPFLVSTA